MSDRRRLVVQQIAERVVDIVSTHPVRVGIDGIDGAGKTTLADELAGAVSAMGRPVIRASIDGFHRSRTERYRRGPESPDGYYRDSFDHVALRQQLLDPLGPDGDGHHRIAVFDHLSDRSIEPPVESAPTSAVLILDGVFLQIPELWDSWELVVWVEASFRTCLARALERDVPLLGSAEAVRERYTQRYHPGQRLYLEECDPCGRAEIVVRNDDPAHPVLLGAFGPGG